MFDGYCSVLEGNVWDEVCVLEQPYCIDVLMKELGFSLRDMRGGAGRSG